MMCVILLFLKLDSHISTCTIIDGGRRNGHFFIKIDHSLIDVEGLAVKACGIHFKLNFIFNVENPKLLENFYDFIYGLHI